MNLSEKYIRAGDEYLMRKPNGALLQMTKTDWERHKAADELLERDQEYIAAHGPINPVRNRVVPESATHPQLRQEAQETVEETGDADLED